MQIDTSTSISPPPLDNKNLEAWQQSYKIEYQTTEGLIIRASFLYKEIVNEGH